MTEDDRTWDLLVVGGGTAGIVGARTAARLGARVALVERDRTGGDCLWTGCVPSKSLLAAARAAAGARRAGGLGVRVRDVEVDFPAVMRHVRSSIAAIEPADSPQALRDAGVTVLHGEARFTGPSSVVVGERPVRFRQALLVTGAAPALPAVPGLADAAPLSSDTLWGLQHLPRRLVVMGGGSIGCELGQALARLGSQVTLVEALPRILSREDPDAAELVHRSMEADGVDVLVGHRAVKVVGSPGAGGEVVLAAAAGEVTVPYDALLVAVGRSPRTTGLGLEQAGVALDERGCVRVDDRLRTTNPRIWAAGDVTAYPPFTHVAGVHGSLAAGNAVLGLRRTVDPSAVPRVTFTDPEVAAVGAASWGGAAPPRTVTVRHAELDRAVAEARTDGFTRLVLDSRHRIVGATVVSPRAGESLAELVLAVRKGLGTGDIAGTIHAYPTYGDGSWNAAVGHVQDRLGSPLARRTTAAMVRARRAWRSRRDPPTARSPQP